MYNLLLKQWLIEKDLCPFTLRNTCVLPLAVVMLQVLLDIFGVGKCQYQNEYFPGQWSRFCGLGSKTYSYKAFLWNNCYNSVVLLNYCSIIYIREVEPSRRWVEKGKKKGKETGVGFQNLSNICVVWQGNLKCQEYKLRKIFTGVYPHYSLPLLFLILFFSHLL